MSDAILVVAFAGLLGAIVGSFLNVCILRLPSNQSIVRPASRCPRCGQGVRWYDNIPVLSWLLLRGRCRHCRNPISIQYPLIELATALIWAGCAYHYGYELDAARAAVFFTLLLGILMTDAQTMLIPHEFTVTGIVVGLASSFLIGPPTPLLAAIGCLTGYGTLWIVGELGKRWKGREAMGGGDLMMMAMVGAFLGVVPVFLTIFLGAVVGTVVFGPVALLRREKNLELPFGVFLALGAAITFLWGDAVINWYRHYLGGN